MTRATSWRPLAARIANAAIRDALALTTTKIAHDAMQGGNAAYARQSELEPPMHDAEVMGIPVPGRCRWSELSALADEPTYIVAEETAA